MEETLAQLHSELRPIYGERETEAIIRLIFHHVKSWNLTDMLIHQKDELSDFVKGEIADILVRLKQHEPIQYIVGEARFHGMDFKIKPGVLIPRPETDELVDIIIDRNKDREDLKILDLCSGSGCIAIALARNLPFSKVTALDLSSMATILTKENAQRLKTRIEVIEADIFQWEPDCDFDIMVSNPPYVMDREALEMEKNVLDFEPHEALFVRDENPLEFYVRIAEIASVHLVEGGQLYLEINPLVVEELVKMLNSKGFRKIDILRDSSGRERFVACVRETD